MRFQVSIWAERLKALVALTLTATLCIIVGYGAVWYFSTVTSPLDPLKDLFMVAMYVLGALASYIIIGSVCLGVRCLHKFSVWITEIAVSKLKTLSSQV